MQRFPDWQPRLLEFLAMAAHADLAPGRHDCALFAAGAIHAMTGVDLGEAWRGKYGSFPKGYAMLRRAGTADIVDLARSHLTEIAPAFAEPGDIAILDGDEGQAFGVVQGEGVYVLMSPRGLGLVSRLSIKHAFKVG